ncbi:MULTISPECIES: ABC transporter ATP-binding protein [Microvirgula]|nr:ABC transporter ATP-binding protein [Microvirgula aerodenitrificans]
MNITTQGLSVELGGLRVLHDISFSAHAGSITTLIGPNGSGKTTLLRALAGLLPHTGQVLQDGIVRSPTRKAMLSPAIGYLPQDCACNSSLSILEVVLMGRLTRLGLSVNEPDREAACRVLDELGLLPLASRAIGSLSGGQRQMVFLAQALAREPRLLLLDEPISALDIQHQLQVLEMIGVLTRQRNLTTLLILHDLNAALRHADQAVLLRQGRVLASGPVHTVLQPAQVGEVFGVEMITALASDGVPVLVARRQKQGLNKIAQVDN